MAAEYVGEAIRALSVEARFTISNMAIEMGAKVWLMEADQKTEAWVKEHSSLHIHRNCRSGCVMPVQGV